MPVSPLQRNFLLQVRRMTNRCVSGSLAVDARHFTFLRDRLRMYSREHGVPHFHAIYGEFSGVVAIGTLEIIEGQLPARAERLVRVWAGLHQADLREIWTSQRFHPIPGLE